VKNINVSFKEEQRIDQWWLRAILLGTAAVLGYSVFITWEDIANHDSITLGLTLWGTVIVTLAILGMVWFWKLTTRIDNYGITIKCPFVHKKVNWDEIEKLEVLDYGFIGGWGIRIGTKYGTAYNTSGSKGMAVVLKNGKKFLIGTQKEEELKKIVEKWKNI
jgi:hypothetical protein